jgi:UDP-N-acetylmuramoyl-tripeptide--D-alanyl-D-alanine ligase
VIQSLSTLRAVAEALGAAVGADGPVTGCSIDSRGIQPGELFFAVRGENTDGHLYVEKALAAGAAGVVLEPRAERGAGPTAIVVPDSLKALQALGAVTRRRWSKPVVCVTGSAGKTTTKEMIAAVLAARYRVRKTEGNYNNEFGLPLSLLRLEDADEIGVFELAMSHAGEIAALAQLARPETGVVTCVAPAHLEFFDSVDGVARAKYELIDALPATGTAVLNADDPRVSAFPFGGRRVTFGIEHDAEFRAEEIMEGNVMQFRVANTRFELWAPGRHQIRNALAAVAVGSLYGVPLQDSAEALRKFRPGKMRGETIEWRGARIVNDSYNSNPQAALAMLDWLARTPAPGPGQVRRAAVLGEMLELGPEGPDLHREVGQHARGLDLVVGVRGLAREIVAAAGAPRENFVETPEEAAAIVAGWIQPGDLVLFKASRGVHLERAIESLMKTRTRTAEKAD